MIAAIKPGLRLRRWLLLLTVVGTLVGGYFTTTVPPQVILAILLLIIVIAVVFFRPAVGVCLILVYAVVHLYVVKNNLVEVQSAASFGPYSPLGAIKDILLLVVVLVWLFKSAGERKLSIITHKYLDISILTFVAVGVVHALNPSNWPIGLWGLRSQTEFILMYFLTKSAINSPRQVKRVVYLFVLLGLLEIMAGYAGFLLLGGDALHTYSASGIVARLTILSDEQLVRIISAATYGTYFSLVFLICVGILSHQRASRNQLWLVITAGGAAVNVVLSLSRRSWLGAAIALVVMATMSKLTSKALVVLIAGLMGFWIFAPPTLITRTGSIFSLTELSNAARLAEWSWLVRRVAQDPIRWVWGLGLGSVGPVSWTFGIAGEAITHNYYVMLLVEMGLPGVLTFAWILVEAVRLGLHLFRTVVDKELKGMVLGISACCVFFTIVGSLGVTFESYPSSLYFWFLLGLLAAVNRMQSKTNLSSSPL